MVRCIPPPPPARPDPSRDAAAKHMQDARAAACRGAAATNHAQLVDSIASVRFFLQAAEDELKPPCTSISLY